MVILVDKEHNRKMYSTVHGNILFFVLFKQYFISTKKGLDNRLSAYIKSSPGLVGLVLYIIYFRIKQCDIQLIQFTLNII